MEPKWIKYENEIKRLNEFQDNLIKNHQKEIEDYKYLIEQFKQVQKMSDTNKKLYTDKIIEEWDMLAPPCEIDENFKKNKPRELSQEFVTIVTTVVFCFFTFIITYLFLKN